VRNAYVMCIAPDERFVFGVIKNAGILAQHILYKGTNAEPLYLTADILKAVELCFLHSSQVYHAVQGIEILCNLPHAQMALRQYFCFQKYSHYISYSGFP